MLYRVYAEENVIENNVMHIDVEAASEKEATKMAEEFSRAEFTKDYDLSKRNVSRNVLFTEIIKA